MNWLQGKINWSIVARLHFGDNCDPETWLWTHFECNERACSQELELCLISGCSFTCCQPSPPSSLSSSSLSSSSSPQLPSSSSSLKLCLIYLHSHLLLSGNQTPNSASLGHKVQESATDSYSFKLYCGSWNVSAFCAFHFARQSLTKLRIFAKAPWSSRLVSSPLAKKPW